MKLEIRVFRDDQAAPVHTEEVETENPLRIYHDLAFKYKIGQPVFPMPDGFRFADGHIQSHRLDK